jgi:hypothetical protein
MATVIHITEISAYGEFGEHELLTYEEIMDKIHDKFPAVVRRRKLSKTEDAPIEDERIEIFTNHEDYWPKIEESFDVYQEAAKGFNLYIDNMNMQIGNISIQQEKISKYISEIEEISDDEKDISNRSKIKGELSELYRQASPIITFANTYDKRIEMLNERRDKISADTGAKLEKLSSLSDSVIRRMHP